MNLGDEIGNDIDFGKLFGAVEDFSATGLELCDQLIDIDPFMPRSIFVEIAGAAVEQFLRATRVAVTEMVQTNSNLNEPLVELSRWSGILGPQFFPYLVRFIEVAAIEVLDPLEITVVVVGFVRHVAPILSNRGGAGIASNACRRNR